MANKSETFEEKIARLESIVKDLEDNSLSIEESLKKYNEGQQIIDELTKYIEEAKSSISISE